MQTSESVRCAEYGNLESRKELIGVLIAISVVSKRLAGRIAALRCGQKAKTRGGNQSEQDE